MHVVIDRNMNTNWDLNRVTLSLGCEGLGTSGPPPPGWAPCPRVSSCGGCSWRCPSWGPWGSDGPGCCPSCCWSHWNSPQAHSGPPGPRLWTELKPVLSVSLCFGGNQHGFPRVSNWILIMMMILSYWGMAGLWSLELLAFIHHGTRWLIWLKNPLRMTYASHWAWGFKSSKFT